MTTNAMVQVLGAVAYGEWKAHEEALAYAAEAATDDERRDWERVAAQELSHHEGFVGRLRALGADPERAMAPYRSVLDGYHGQRSADEVEDAVWSYLGEGIAEDLLHWLARVGDDQTAALITRVLADEEEHEAGADQRVRDLVRATPANRLRALAAPLTMLGRMAASGSPQQMLPLRAFLGAGRSAELLAAITSGFARRSLALSRAALLPARPPPLL